jgi:guanylate kinase
VGDVSTTSPTPPATPRPVLVVIGPSASGKSTVVRELARRGIVRVHPTWTTRPRRPDERRGSLEHRFVTEQVFDQLVADGFFLEAVRLFGLPYRYGLPPLRPSATGPLDAVMLRAPVVPTFARSVPRHLVYQVEDPTDRPRERLVQRGVGAEEVAARLDDNRREIAAGRRIADRVFRNDGSLDELVDRVATAVRCDAGVRAVA